MTRDDRAVVVDVGAMLGVGVAVCLASQRLSFMTALVVAALVVRLALACAWGGRALRVELPFFALCTLLGAANDWNTVVRHGVYVYSVPTDLAWSTIPLWMLLYWGLVLRAIASLASSARLGETRASAGMGSVAAQLALVLATRQAIYRLWSDPFWSWAPFALALLVYVLVLRPPERARRLALVALVAGPPVEMAFIHLGGLHRYALGWFFGVPLWIVLWWALGVLVFADLAPRLERALARALTPARRSLAPSA